ncbi:hypothetical protein AB3S75_036768 [Citrus x aurantiifolia]
MKEHKFLVKEMDNQIVSLEKIHRLQIQDEALFLASHIAQHPRNKATGELRERFIDILLKGIKRCLNSRDKYQKELDKHKYFLRRAVVEYQQLVKEDTDHSSRSFWLRQIDNELKDAFFELVSFMKLRMQVEYDDFVSCVHDAKRMKDYSKILDQIDARVHGKFKEKLAVDVEEIAEVASKLTGIPASWFCTKPEERYMRVQERLKKRVFGQNDAIDVIFEALTKPKAAEKGLSSRRQLGLFLFAGPNCSGKAELAKAIANELYDNNDNDNHLIHFDMGNYTELESIKHFFDSLAALVKKMPYSVVLFDKIEKANSSILNLLLKILKTDFNRKATRGIAVFDLTNTLIIMTSDLKDEQVFEVMLTSTYGRVNEVTGSLFKPSLLKLLDKLVVIDLAVPLLDTTRLLLREWACEETKRRNNDSKAVIVCPSTSALVHIASNAARKYGQNGEGLKRWVDQRVIFPMMSKMIVEDDGVPGNISVYIDLIEEIGELSFNLKRN